jgi:hypothetical protein
MNYYYADENNQAIGPITEDQLRALVLNGSITPDTQVLQEGTTEWCQYGLIAPPPNPPGMTTMQPLRAAPVGKPNAKNTSKVVLVTILAAAIILGSVYYYAKAREREQVQRAAAKPPKPSPKADEKIDTVVDTITGFSTFVLGAPSADFASRVKVKWAHTDCIETTINELLGAEREWAGFPVKEVGLRFEEGMISIVRVKLNPDALGFLRAFELRYGKPKGPIYADLTIAHWEGNDTKVDIVWGLPDGIHITITSKKIHDFIESQQAARFKKEIEAAEQRAHEAAKKF